MIAPALPPRDQCTGVPPRDQRTGVPPAAAQVLLACLCSSGAALRELCAHPEIDWPRVAVEARLHRVAPLVLDALQRSGVVGSAPVPADVVADLRRQRRALAALSMKLDAALPVALDALAAEDVPAIVLKGPALARLYPRPSLRPQSDLDLLVDPVHWPAAERVLAGLGYRLLEAAHVRRPRLSPLLAPEDRQYRHVGDGTMIELHADYLNTGLRRADDALVWRRARTVEANGLRFPTLSPGDTVLHLTTHVQRHAFTRLLWFYDFYLLLRSEGETIAWTDVAQQAERAGVLASAYFGLSYTEALFGPLIVPEARRALRPNALRRRLHEELWPRRRILSLDSELIRRLDAQQQAGLSKAVPLPPTVFDMYDPPGRMLAHLLVSGNVWPKLYCLGRRAIPSEEWLRFHGPHDVRHYRVRLLLARIIDSTHWNRALARCDRA